MNQVTIRVNKYTQDEVLDTVTICFPVFVIVEEKILNGMSFHDWMLETNSLIICTLFV